MALSYSGKACPWKVPSPGSCQAGCVPSHRRDPGAWYVVGEAALGAYHVLSLRSVSSLPPCSSRERVSVPGVPCQARPSPPWCCGCCLFFKRNSFGVLQDLCFELSPLSAARTGGRPPPSPGCPCSKLASMAALGVASPGCGGQLMGVLCCTMLSSAPVLPAERSDVFPLSVRAVTAVRFCYFPSPCLSRRSGCR